MEKSSEPNPYDFGFKMASCFQGVSRICMFFVNLFGVQSLEEEGFPIFYGYVSLFSGQKTLGP